jgi:hypothetical protein
MPAWVAGLVMGAGALTLLCGCPWLVEVAAYQQKLNEWLKDTDNWPQVSVRIVNHTDAVANVYLASAGRAPPAPAILGYPGEADYYAVETPSVLVNSNGTATGDLKCGEVLGFSINVPFDVDAASMGYTSYTDDAYGLYLSPGNCVLSGAGVSPAAFSGDTFTLVRYVRPAEDGLDCATQTLVITIETAGAPSVIDPQTGQVVTSARLGAATLSIE